MKCTLCSGTGEMPEPKYVVKAVVLTCSACPSQWDGVLDDGRSIYVRYRWGGLSIRVASEVGPEGDAVGGKEIFSGNFGDGLDGVMSYEELKTHTLGVFSWPEAQVSDEEFEESLWAV